MDVPPRRVGRRWSARGRDGPRQDGADHRALARARGGRSCAGGRAHLGDQQLGGGAAALRALAHAGHVPRRATREAAGRRGPQAGLHHQLRHAGAGRGAAAGHALRRARGGRGPGHQERPHATRQVGARGARPLARCVDRHTRREPPAQASGTWPTTLPANRQGCCSRFSFLYAAESFFS